MPTQLTRALGNFASTLAFNDLPQLAVDTARLGITDFVGAMFAGAEEPVAKIVLNQLETRGPTGEARIVFGAEYASAPEAALANGVAGHVLQYDDTGLQGHPSAILVPAILAEAEALGASGRAAIAAYVTGFEVWADLNARDPDSHARKGWHGTNAIGTVAAAAAIANLRQLDAQKATMAIAIAASMSGGIAANSQTDVKTYQTARASSSGIVAARLADAGLTGNDTALEHPKGLLRALSPRDRVDVETPFAMPRPAWIIAEKGINVKKYPMCYGALRPIDAMVDLAQKQNICLDDIRKITVKSDKNEVAMLRYHDPQNRTDAGFSIEFAMAAALMERRVGLTERTMDFVRRDDVQALMHKVSIVASQDAALEDDPRYGAFDNVEVELMDGKILKSSDVEFPRGHKRMPLGRDELWMKFCDCTAGALSRKQAQVLFDGLQSLEQQGNLRDLGVVSSAIVMAG